MSTLFVDGHVEIDSTIAGGKPSITGHRISVQDVVIWHERLGHTADEIASEYGLSLGDVHASLAYYFDHREEIDRAITESDAFAESLRQRTPSKLTARLPESLHGAAG